jgi:hypothetical protein
MYKEAFYRVNRKTLYKIKRENYVGETKKVKLFIPFFQKFLYFLSIARISNINYFAIYFNKRLFELTTLKVLLYLGFISINIFLVFEFLKKEYFFFRALNFKSFKFKTLNQQYHRFLQCFIVNK